MAEMTLDQALQLALRHHQGGRLAEAEHIYRQILAQQPDYADALHLLGVLAGQAGQLDVAIDHISRAIAINASNAVYHTNLGKFLTDARRFEEAVGPCRQAVRISPGFADAHFHLGLLLNAQDQFDEAVESYRRTLAIKPDHTQARINMGNILKQTGQLAEAIDCFRKAMRYESNRRAAHSNLLNTLHFHPECDARALGEELRSWNQQHALPLKQFMRPHDNDRTPDRRLRIGYVSPDFCDHCQALFTVPLFSAHDRQNFEIVGYSDVAALVDVTRRLQGYCHQWRNIAGMSDEQVAQQIRADKIDILVDLTMHMANNRLLVFARKPAPVQVSWLAYPGSTGVEAIDYRLTDRYLDPVEAEGNANEARYSEASIRLPDSFWCYDPLAEEPAVNGLPAETSGAVTFGCLNNFCKVNDDVLSLWSQVLGTVSKSRMILLTDEGRHRDRIWEVFGRQGIAPERIEFVAYRPRADYLKLYHRIDIGLDTFPYNGHTTSLDSFWMGVPVVTLVGKTVVGRAGLCQLMNLGLPELIAHTGEEYVRIAAGLAADRGRLSELRAGLRARMRASPLMDAPRFARGMEAAYRGMWKKWCCAESATPDHVGTARPPLAVSATGMMDSAKQGFSGIPTIDEALLIAAQHHQAGRLPEAEAIYRQVLAQQPEHARALHMLGVLAGQTGRIDAAVELIRRTIAHCPSDAAYHNNLGKFLSDAGRLDEAIAACRNAIALKPDYAGAHYNLGFAWQRKGELGQAIASYDQAIRHHPNHATAYNNRGNALKDLGQRQEAMASYRAALRITPENAEARYNLGNALFDAGELAEAEACFREAVRLKPTADGYNSLAAVLNAQGHQEEAITCCRESLRLNPALADAHCNLGLLLCHKGLVDQAVALCREALRLKPDFAEAYCNLGMVLKERGELAEAIDCFREAIRIKPGYDVSHSNLAYLLQFHPDYDAQAIRNELRRWNETFAVPLKKHIRPHGNDRDPGRRLRIGYVSPDFRDHVVGRNLLPLFREHDRGLVEIVCYANLHVPDAITEKFRAGADQWHSIAAMGHDEVAQLIRADGIDILVDLSLHMGGNRLLVFAGRPAPVQVTFAGYPGSTGLEAMDYRLTDPHLDPAGEEAGGYCEKSIRLPHSFWCYDPLSAEPEVRALPLETRGVVTFGCLNNFCKVNASMLALWTQILKTVEGSRLMLLAAEGSHRQNTLDILRQHGIAPARIAFVAGRPHQDYLALYHDIDIGLDTLPYNGHTTSLDSYWMGVPVVTLVGKTVVGRAGLSQLMNLGLPELIAHTPEQYVRIAAELAGDAPRLAALRASLRPRMRASPLMDARGFARGIEAAYREMWKQWCDLAVAV